MRTCKRCGVAKDITEFYHHRGYPAAKCKPCCRESVKENYRKNIDHYRDYEKRRFKSLYRKQKMLEYQRNRRKRDPEKNKARSVLWREIRKGSVVPPKACSMCNATGRIEAHHHDYSKPLDVIWVCFKCHREKCHGQVVG